jgi:filamentous hemagglutinin
LQLGIALGQIFGGLVRVVQGGLMIKGGFALSATGVGAIAGVPAIGVGAVWALAGAANIVAGIDGLSHALSTGSGSGAATGGGALKAAGQAADRGGLTKAGRALAKHGGREGSAFPMATGNPAAINKQGQAILDDILENVSSTRPNKFGGTDYFGPGGRGARYDAAGNLMGFLEP